MNLSPLVSLAQGLHPQTFSWSPSPARLKVSNNASCSGGGRNAWAVSKPGSIMVSLSLSVGVRDSDFLRAQAWEGTKRMNEGGQSVCTVVAVVDG